jgi:hypothetical protein
MAVLWRGYFGVYLGLIFEGAFLFFRFGVIQLGIFLDDPGHWARVAASRKLYVVH